MSEEKKEFDFEAEKEAKRAHLKGKSKMNQQQKIADDMEQKLKKFEDIILNNENIMEFEKKMKEIGFNIDIYYSEKTTLLEINFNLFDFLIYFPYIPFEYGLDTINLTKEDEEGLKKYFPLFHHTIPFLQLKKKDDELISLNDIPYLTEKGLFNFMKTTYPNLYPKMQVKKLKKQLKIIREKADPNYARK